MRGEIFAEFAVVHKFGNRPSSDILLCAAQYRRTFWGCVLIAHRNLMSVALDWGGHEEATGLTLVGGAAIWSRSKAGIGFGDLLHIYCHSVRGRQQNIRDFDADFPIVPDCAGM